MASVRIAVTLAATVDLPEYPANDPECARQNVYALLNTALRISTLARVADATLGQHPNGPRFQAALLRAYRSEAKLAEALMDSCAITVTPE